jgi:hypothetical protein
MFKLFYNTLFCYFIAITTLHAQSVNYQSVDFKADMPAIMPSLQGYKTFDLTFTNRVESFFKKENPEDLDFQLGYDKFAKVENSEELHIFSTLYSLKLGKNTENKQVYDVDLHTIITNKYGTVLFENHFDVQSMPYLNYTRNTKYSLRHYCLEQAIDRSFSAYLQDVHGYTGTYEGKLAKLDDVKKKTELYEFVDQVKVLSPALSKSIPAFLDEAAKYVPFWEKMTQYSEGKNPDEVKRAAYQNLSLYYILSQNTEKAQATIAAYKKVDKEIKQMFGLVKYKNSESCEKLLNALTPKPVVVIDEKKGGTEILTKSAIAERLMYHTIDGTVRIKDKKIGGTYTGLIKVKNVLTTGKASNMMNLDATDIDVQIVGKNEKGEAVTLNTYLSKIEDLKSNDGKKYIAQKFSDALSFAASGNAGYYALLNVSYESPKVTVFRCVIPSSYSTDYVVRKTGDAKGVRSGNVSGFLDSKKIMDYLSDCPAFKTDEVDKKASVEALAEKYSNCK